MFIAIIFAEWDELLCVLFDVPMLYSDISAQSGTSENDYIHDAALGSDGNYIFGGNTNGNWNATHAGLWDWAVFKVDEQGNFLWKWQVNAARSSYGVWTFLLRTEYVPLEQVAV